MNCPVCSSETTSVRKTYPDRVVVRKRACKCGAEWTTDEKVRKGSLKVTTNTAHMGTNAPVCIKDSELDQDQKEQEPRQVSPLMGTNARRKLLNYSEYFEQCWSIYGRKQEKDKAFARWRIEAKAIGSEESLRDAVIAALEWQGPMWAEDGWKYAKYFERYLKAKRWKDERPPAIPRSPVSVKRDDLAARTEAVLAKKRAEVNEDNLPDWAQLKALRNGG